MLSDKPGPAITTPHLCSVAYFTLTECCGKDGNFRPADMRNLQMRQPCTINMLVNIVWL